MYERRKKFTVSNVEEKIKFTRNRINKCIKWDAPKEYEKLRLQCIKYLGEHIVFFNRYKELQAKKNKLCRLLKTRVGDL